MAWRFPLVIGLACLALAGCEREPPRTTVHSAGKSLPDSTVLRPQAGTTTPAPAPARQEPASPTQDTAAAPTPDAGLPHVADAGDAQGAALLAQKTLQLPVVGVRPTALSNQYSQGRVGHTHEAIDILAPAGTPVVAVDDGRIAKLFTSKPGGLTVYQFDPDTHLAYYYAHLQGYAPGLTEGMEVKRGDLVGYVGSTGNADAKTPHLHFAVFRLGTPARWWQGEAVNPYPALSRAQVTQSVASR